MISRIGFPTTIYNQIYKASTFCFQNYVWYECSVAFSSICTFKKYTLTLNVECFDLAVTANFVYYADHFYYKISVFLHFLFFKYPRLVTDIDVFVGGISELPEEGSILGPLFNCLIGKQFHDLKFGDRYWFENPGMGGFTPGN